ncbi:MAG: hypothetical protein KME42_11170 [Tildeniella nuda ZEHNDER 1965/U140]|nr:hypothetical protein [Tildeniella nuda ZEHNDER 1965/U140]
MTVNQLIALSPIDQRLVRDGVAFSEAMPKALYQFYKIALQIRFCC